MHQLIQSTLMDPIQVARSQASTCNKQTLKSKGRILSVKTLNSDISQVDQQGTMLNIFVDGEGQPQYVPVGNIGDLGSVDAAALGGVPIGDLEKAHEKQVRGSCPGSREWVQAMGLEFAYCCLAPWCGACGRHRLPSVGCRGSRRRL